MKGGMKSSVTTMGCRPVVVMVAAALAAMALPVTAAESLEAALAGGKAGLDLRYRYEMVDQTGIAEKAKASTLRTRLNYATESY